MSKLVLLVGTSHLPRWRGSSPLPKTILSGDQTSGVSLMLLSPYKFDHGKIISQKQFTVPEDVFTHDLARIALKEGNKLLVDCLDNIEQSVANSKPQSKHGITYAYKLSANDAFINWDRVGVDDVWRTYRALSFRFPLKTFFNGKQVKLLEMLHPKYTTDESLVPSNFADDDLVRPGAVCVSHLIDAVCVKCTDGFAGFKKVQISGRKQLDALNFANGYFNLSNSFVHFNSKITQKQ